MGAPTPTTPRDSAPAYEDLYFNHPVNQQPPAGPSTAYAAVPQTDHYENEHQHEAPEPENLPTAPSETVLQTLVAPFRAKPHVHCEACELLQERREKRQNERHCCGLVAATFIVAFICLLLLGVVVVHSTAKRGKGN